MITKKDLVAFLISNRFLKNKITVVVGDNPFEQNEYIFTDYSFIALEDQIAVFNNAKSVLVYYKDVIDVKSLPVDFNDVAERLVEMPADEIENEYEILDDLQAQAEINKINEQHDLLLYEIKNYISKGEFDEDPQEIYEKVISDIYDGVIRKLTKDEIVEFIKIAKTIIKEKGDLPF